MGNLMLPEVRTLLERKGDTHVCKCVCVCVMRETQKEKGVGRERDLTIEDRQDWPQQQKPHPISLFGRKIPLWVTGRQFWAAPTSQAHLLLPRAACGAWGREGSVCHSLRCPFRSSCLLLYPYPLPNPASFFWILCLCSPKHLLEATGLSPPRVWAQEI